MRRRIVGWISLGALVACALLLLSGATYWFAVPYALAAIGTFYGLRWER